MQMNIHLCLCDETTVKSSSVSLCSFLEQMLKYFSQQSTPQIGEKNKQMCQMVNRTSNRSSYRNERLHIRHCAAGESLWTVGTLLQTTIRRGNSRSTDEDKAPWFSCPLYAHTIISAHRHTHTQSFFSIILLENLYSEQTIQNKHFLIAVNVAVGDR